VFIDATMSRAAWWQNGSFISGSTRFKFQRVPSVIVPTMFPNNFHDNTLLVRVSSDFIISSPFSTHSTITIFHRLQCPTIMKDLNAKIPSKIVKYVLFSYSPGSYDK
jgi:hypothetical protein